MTEVNYKGLAIGLDISNIYVHPPPEQDEELIGSISITLILVLSEFSESTLWVLSKCSLSALRDGNTLALILEQKMICLKNIHRGNTD